MTSFASVRNHRGIGSLLRKHFLLYCPHSCLVLTTRKYNQCSDFILYVLMYEVNSAAVYLGVCPVLFALYLILRTAADQWLLFYKKIVKRYRDLWFEHIIICRWNITGIYSIYSNMCITMIINRILNPGINSNQYVK